MDIKVAQVILTLLVVLWITLFPVYFFKMRSLLNYLKEKHEEEWRKLGSPSMFLNNSIQNGFNLQKLIWAKESFGDEQLSKKLQVLKRLLIAYFVLAGLILLAGFLLSPILYQ